MIKCKNLTKQYVLGSVPLKALDDVSFSIETGEYVAIMGPSGSGKSTVMHILGLLDLPDSGTYELDGKEVQSYTENELADYRSKTIGFVFQKFHLLSRNTALDNVLLPRIYVRGQEPASIEQGKSILDQVGLGDRREHQPNELSGGQQQRVAVARSLMNNPKLLLADEPTGNLDSKSQDEILDLFDSLNAEGITVVLITHDEEVAQHARRIIRLKDGKIVSDEQIKPEPSSKIERLLSPSKKISYFSKFRLETQEHVRQAAKALWSNKVRTLLSMLGILIGVSSVIAMSALGNGAKKEMETRLSTLGANMLVLRPGNAQMRGVSLDSGAPPKFTVQDDEAIRKTVASIKRTAPSVNGRIRAVYGNKNFPTQLLATTPEYAPMRALEPTMGRFFTSEENKSRARVAVIGMTVVRELFADPNTGRIQSPIGETLKINKMNFQIIGILPEKGASSFQDQDSVVIIPLETGMKRVLGKSFVDNINIEADGPLSIASVQENVKSLMIERHHLPPSREDSFEVRDMSEIQQALSATSVVMSMLLTSISAISLLVGGIGIMNIMLVSVTERTREIGLRKALGARSADILSQFLIEALVISLSGGFIGINMGVLISLCLSWFAGWTVLFTAQSILVATVFSMAIGVGFGLWPARQAAKLNPIEALRYE